MILAVNVGNTHITIGGYQDDQRVFSARLRTSLQCSSDEYAIKLLDLLRLHQIPRSRLSGAILSSVVPAISGVVLVALGKLCPMRVLTVGPGLKSGLNICIENPAQLGGELLCGGVAALQLAAPPLLTQARDRQADTTALTRPAVAGVMTDEERLDPTISALYSQKILSASNNFLVGEENSQKYSRMSGKLRQANRRGLLSDEQLNALLAFVDVTEAAETAEQGDYHYTGLHTCIFYSDAAGVEQLLSLIHI